MFPWETLITGVVGLAGIGGTLWQGKRSREAQTADLKASLDATTENLRLNIKAEDERVRIAEKRRIYSEALSAFRELTMATTAHRWLHSSSVEVRKDSLSRLEKAKDAAFVAGDQLILVAPSSMHEIVSELQNASVNYMGATIEGASIGGEDRSDIGKIQAKLFIAMRTDLGETD
jgi:hypothetical protein